MLRIGRFRKNGVAFLNVPAQTDVVPTIGAVTYGFDSADHDTTLTHVAAGSAVCLAPAFLNDHTGESGWTPFACPEKFDIVLCRHAPDKRESLLYFIKTLQKLHGEKD